MQFLVPQYIDIEDKLFGPLSFRQFVYVAGGAGLAFLAYRFLPFWAAILIIIPVLSFAIALAFYKVNNRPFLTILEYAIKHYLKPKLYVWQSTERFKKQKGEEELLSSPLAPSLSEGHLKELTWSLDVKQIEQRDPEDVRTEVRPLQNPTGAPTPKRPGIITPPTPPSS